MSQDRTTGEALKERMPKDPRAFLQLAEEHRRTGRLKEAIAVCLESLGQHPALHAARVTLGRSYLEAGQLKEARATLQEVFSLLPEHQLAAKLLAETQRRMGDREAAVATCKAILVHYPRDREFEAILAEILAERELPVPDAPAQPAASPAAASPPATPAVRTTPPPSPQPIRAGASRTISPAVPADPDLEYRPEDVAIPDTPSSPRPGAVRPAPAATGTRDGDALQTNTLAELYLRQGLVERAMEVYRAMLRVDPANDRASRRLADLEKMLSTGILPGGQGSAVATTAGTEAAGHEPASGPGRPRDTIARLESWLHRVTAGSSGIGRSARR